jgi:3-isopropylmalate dehydrogenase
MQHLIVVLPGDGIGPEVTAAAIEVLQAVARRHTLALAFETLPFGGAAIDAHGEPLPAAVLARCREASAILLGAVGGPKWASVPVAIRPEAGLLALRQQLGLFANLRPVKPHRALLDLSPVRRERVEGTDMIVVRELTGGIYFGARTRTADRATDECAYTVAEIERVTRVAATLARARQQRLVSVDKANVLETSRLWRETVTALMANEYPDIAVEHLLVDAMAMYLISRPRDFDVVLTENLFGDILTDETAALTGSLGMMPSASIGVGGPGLYEPIHGSAPDIAGRGIANPYGTILSAAMLLRHSLGHETAAHAIEQAVDAAIDASVRTPDLGGRASTVEATRAVLDALATEVTIAE